MVGRRTRGRIYPLVNWVAGSYPALEPWCGRLQQSKVVSRGLVGGRGVCLVAAIAYGAALTKVCIVLYRTRWHGMVSYRIEQRSAAAGIRASSRATPDDDWCGIEGAGA